MDPPIIDIDKVRRGEGEGHPLHQAPNVTLSIKWLCCPSGTNYEHAH
jgi:hypothetical protein